MDSNDGACDCTISGFGLVTKVILNIPFGLQDLSIIRVGQFMEVLNCITILMFIKES